MMIGPEPISMIDWMSVRLGIESLASKFCHEVDEAIEIDNARRAVRAMIPDDIARKKSAAPLCANPSTVLSFKFR